MKIAIAMAVWLVMWLAIDPEWWTARFWLMVLASIIVSLVIMEFYDEIRKIASRE